MKKKYGKIDISKCKKSKEPRFAYLLFFEMNNEYYVYNTFGPPGYINKITKIDAIPSDVKAELSIKESLSLDKLDKHVLAFFVKYGKNYYNNDASILEYLQNNDEDNSDEQSQKMLKDALQKAMSAYETINTKMITSLRQWKLIKESIDMTKYNVGDILPYGEKVFTRTLSIMNNTIAIDILRPSEAEKLSEILISNGFDARYEKSGNYYDMVLVTYKLPFDHGKFASLIEDTLGCIYLNNDGKRIRNTKVFENQTSLDLPISTEDKESIKNAAHSLRSKGYEEKDLIEELSKQFKLTVAQIESALKWKNNGPM